MARYLKQEMGISVSHNFVSTLWREHDLQPYRQGTFKLSTDPDFEEEVVDVVGGPLRIECDGQLFDPRRQLPRGQPTRAG